MAIDLTLKSASITNADASPVVLNTGGAGAPEPMFTVDDYKTVPAALSITSRIRLVRLPTTCKVKSVIFESEAQGAGKFDLGLYYTVGSANAGAVVDADFFASAIDCASLVTPTEVVNESTQYSLNERVLPLWQAAGLSADPGGHFDVVATVVTTDVTTGTGKLGVRVGFVN